MTVRGTVPKSLLRSLVVLGLLLPALLPGSLFAAGDMERGAEPDPRSIFLDAWKRLAAGSSVDLDAVTAELGDYPLTPYLQWQALRHRMHSASADEIRRFTERYPTLPVTSRLEFQWLLQLGRAARWREFLDADNGRHGGATLDCYRLRALEADAGIDDGWIEAARELWTVGYSQPEACDPVFAVLYERDLLTPERRWERIRLIMTANDTRLARALRGRLSAEQQGRLDSWLKVAGAPARSLSDPDFEPDTEWGRQIVEDGIRRLAVRDRDAAGRLVEQYADLLGPSTVGVLQRRIALRAAWSRDADALELLDALPASAVDSQVREWSARVALGRQDWERLLRAIWALPSGEQQRGEWRYWKAEALRRTGQREQAGILLAELARERSYYGFLAADAIGSPYSLNHRPATAGNSELDALMERRDLLRAHELNALGLQEEARREWHAAFARLSADERRRAALLASRWGWHDRALHAANQSGLTNDLALRFPVVWPERYRQHAEEHGVDPSLVYAISRKESAFTPDARSPVGALGLMQVMPGTARAVAERLGMPRPAQSTLVDPDINLRLGVAYLAEMLERFDGNAILAVAAYNAGPSRVERWQEANAGQPAAVWIENITFAETRDYVKSVLAFRAVYDWQLRGESRSLAGLMPTMPSPGEALPGLALYEAGKP